MHVRRVLVAAALLLILGACSDGSDDATPSATVGTEPATTTTTDPYAIPPVIDAAYVNHVLAGLDAVQGDVARLVVSRRTLPREAFDRLSTIYANGERLQLALDLIQDELRGGLKGYKPNPGNPHSSVLELISATPTCVYARVQRDYSEVALAPIPEARTQWIAIRPMPPSNFGYNPTGWGFEYEGFERGFRAPPEDPCAGF